MGPLFRSGTTVLIMATLLLLGGCAHHRYWMGRYVERSLVLHAQEIPVTRTQARVRMDRLEVTLNTQSNEQAYRSDFLLEERYVAQACIAVARSEVVFDQRWSVMHLEVWNTFGKGFQWRANSGLYLITMPREDMERIRTGAVTVVAVPHLWQRKLAVKQGPDHELIEWPEDVVEPLRRKGK